MRLRWWLAGVGVLGACTALIADPHHARSAASQVWPPFVLVSGLLLIGLVADDDGVFAAAGQQLARVADSGIVLFIGAVVLIGLVTAFLNLDTSVAFLTPVMVYTARSRGEGEAPLLYGCLLLSNAGSLLLPGSNLTNLIVLGHIHLTGHEFIAHMGWAWLAALFVTAAVIGLAERRSLRLTRRATSSTRHATLGLGVASVILAGLFVTVLPSPALPVAAVGGLAVAVRLARRTERPRRVLDVLGLPVHVGLFGVAVALGTAGRAWNGPATLLSHVNTWGAAAIGAVAAVLVNNLPAAALLGARTPPNPFALLVGLNLGPNLLATGSLAWYLWLSAARSAGARPSLTRASRLGVIAVPLSMAAAVGALALTGAH